MKRNTTWKKAGELFGIVYEVGAIEEDWVNAMHENTISAYKSFVIQHPNSVHQSEAEVAIIIGGTYARYLADILNSNFLPPKTDSYYVQIVDTDSYSGTTSQGVSFIEFAGEQFRDMAFVEDSFASEDLGPTLSSILKNDNPKILFWAIDSTKQ